MDPSPDPDMELVEVTWRDAFFELDVPDPEALNEDFLVRSVGWLLAEGPTFLSVAGELLPDGRGWRAVTSIPVGMVIGVRVLNG